MGSMFPWELAVIGAGGLVVAGTLLPRSSGGVVSLPGPTPANSLPQAEPKRAPRELNVEALMERVGNDGELLADLADLFSRQSGEHLAELHAAFAARDAGRVARVTHTLRGALGTVSAMSAWALSQSIEQSARGGRLASAAGEIQELDHRVRGVAAELCDLATERGLRCAS